MQEYRINNQAFCERNYIPKTLGWYLLTPTTCVSDMEWTLARAAGFDAGLAFDAVFLMATNFSCSTCRVSKIRIERGYPIASRYSTHPNRRQ